MKPHLFRDYDRRLIVSQREFFQLHCLQLKRHNMYIVIKLVFRNDLRQKQNILSQ